MHRFRSAESGVASSSPTGDVHSVVSDTEKKGGEEEIREYADIPVAVHEDEIFEWREVVRGEYAP